MSHSYNRNSERFLDGLVKASKLLQPHFYESSAFVERAVEDPFSLYKEMGVSQRVCLFGDYLQGNPFYEKFQGGLLMDEDMNNECFIILYTRHKQKQRFSEHEFHQQGTTKFKKKIQKFGYTYTFYKFPKALLEVFNQYKDGFDLVLKFDETIKYLDSRFLNQGLDAL